MKEEWRIVDGFPNYKVSNKGRIMSNHKTNKWHLLNPSLHDGRPTLNLFGDGVQRCTSVGRLVAKAFIPNPDNLPIVRHKNDHPYDNYISNLEWGTYKDNAQDAIRNGTFKTEKSYKPVLATNLETGEEIFFQNRQDCATFFKVSKSVITERMKKEHPEIQGYRLEPSHFERWWSK